MKYCMIVLITIIASSAFAQTEISGEVSGVLPAENSPYIAIDSLFVPRGDTLIIEPGVDIFFDPHTALSIRGSLIASGTEQDSIRFLPNQLAMWDGIALRDTTTHRFDYCRLFGAKMGLGIGLSCMVTINHSVFVSDSCVITGIGRFTSARSTLNISYSRFVCNTDLQLYYYRRITASYSVFDTGLWGGDYRDWGLDCSESYLELDHCIVYGSIISAGVMGGGQPTTGIVVFLNPTIIFPI